MNGHITMLAGFVRNSLEHRIIFFAFIILSLTTLATAGVNIAGFRRDYIQAQILRSQSIGLAMKSSIEKILSLGLRLHDIPGLDEKCRDIVVSNPDITYAVVTSQEGHVLHSSDPIFKNIHIRTNPHGHGNRTTQLVLGPRTFYNTAIALHSYDGTVTGYIHIGLPSSSISSKVYSMALKSGAVFVVFFLISFACVVVFVKRYISGPIGTLLAGVKTVAEGDFKLSLPEMTTSEFKELAEKIETMAASLASRDAALHSNYEELATTHNQLRDSFQKLELLSSQLEKSEELYKTLLEDAGDAIIVLDQNATVALANKKAEELLGYSANELIDKHISSLLLSLQAENIPHILQIVNAAKTGTPIVEELTMHTKQQVKVIGQMQIGCIRAGGQTLLQVIIRDVTRERQLLNNLEASAAELTRLNKMKDSFLGMASHELKTPLTVIMGYTELLLQDMSHDLTPTVCEMTQHISTAALRLNSIIRDMVDVSMIDRKKIALKLEPVDINELIEQATQEQRLFFTLRKQVLSLHLDPELPVINGDKSRLIQLLANLINNAIKFTPDGGEIRIQTSSREILRSKQPPGQEPSPSLLHIGREPHRYVEISIADTGIGIAKEEQLHIFDKFYESGNIEEHSSGKVAFKARGAGLGLSIARGMVEMHGGEIWVESSGHDPEQCPGSTFFILLPLDPSKGDGTIENQQQ
jgi:hypothetical protein